MCKMEETPPLLAGQYRRLWLDAENELGVVAETLADVLGWQRTPDQPLPDALELAEAAAARIANLEGIVAGAKHRPARRPSTPILSIN